MGNRNNGPLFYISGYVFSSIDGKIKGISILVMFRATEHLHLLFIFLSWPSAVVLVLGRNSIELKETDECVLAGKLNPLPPVPFPGLFWNLFFVFRLEGVKGTYFSFTWIFLTFILFIFSSICSSLSSLSNGKQNFCCIFGKFDDISKFLIFFSRLKSCLRICVQVVHFSPLSLCLR